MTYRVIAKNKRIVIVFASLFSFFIVFDFCFAAVQQPVPTVVNYTYDPSGQRITVSNG